MSGKRSALIVATSQYSDQRLTGLDGPGHDAEALQTVLQNAEIGGFDVQVALNSQVDTLRRTLETFFTNRARDDLLLVHFSGHGLKDDDGQLYLAAADTEIDRLLSTGVDASWVNRLMNKCRSEKIALFLDCCFAGAFTSGMARRVGVDSAGVKEQFTGSGLFVIAASDAMQYSFEGGQQVGLPPEPSPFTKALVDGLRTGEADRNEDGVVSINELFDYLEDRIRQTSPSQTPTKSAFNQVGDWAIARSTRVPSVRLLPEDLQKLLKSEDALDRFGALIYLRDLIEGADPRVAEAAMQALQALAHDDSRRVAAAAQRLAAKETAGSAATTGSDAGPSTVIEEPAAPPEQAMPIVHDAAPSTSEPAQPEPASPPPAPAASAAAAVVLPVEPTVVLPDEPTVVAPVEPAAAAPIQPAVVAAAETPRAPSGWGQPASSGGTPGWGQSPPASAGRQAATVGAMWGQSNVQAQVAPNGAAQGRSERAEAPWSMWRAAARAFVGSLLFAIFLFAMFIDASTDFSFDPDAAVAAFAALAVLIATLATVVVAIAEKAVPSVRLPGGAVYRLVGGNRWLAAGTLGIVVGLILGPLIVDPYLGYMSSPWFPLLEWELFAALVAFVVAEAVVGKRSGGASEERTKAA